jgi:hypothetical protein
LKFEDRSLQRRKTDNRSKTRAFERTIAGRIAHFLALVGAVGGGMTGRQFSNEIDGSLNTIRSKV